MSILIGFYIGVVSSLAGWDFTEWQFWLITMPVAITVMKVWGSDEH